MRPTEVLMTRNLTDPKRLVGSEFDDHLMMKSFTIQILWFHSHSYIMFIAFKTKKTKSRMSVGREKKSSSGLDNL